MKEIGKKKVYLNSIIVLLTQMLQILLGFAVRKVFIRQLSIELLGYNAVFLNILDMLNLADLGIGVAVTSFLYGPLVKQKTGQINVLMSVYKKIYQVIGCFIALIGFLASFFVPYLIKEASYPNWYIQLLFCLNLAGTVCTYFLAYRRTLLIADQKTYVTAISDSFVYTAISLLQMFFLYYYPDYTLYTLISVFKNILSNITLYWICGRDYPYLKSKVDTGQVKEAGRKLFAYVKEVTISRIGAFIFYGTDNVIISLFKGAALTGIASNYYLVVNQVKNVMIQVLSSLQATLGHYLLMEKSEQERRNMIDTYFYIDFLIGNFCMISVAFLIQPFISLWLGEAYLLKDSTAVCLGINLFFSILLTLPTQLFTIHRLFRYDKIMIMVAAVFNILLSVVLIQVMGIDGVLIGTLAASLIYLYCRIYLLDRFLYADMFRSYLKKLLFYYLISFTNFAAVFLMTAFLSRNGADSFILRILLVGSMNLAVPLCLTFRTLEFKILITRFLVPFLKKN